jgi:hypothetical protein
VSERALPYGPGYRIEVTRQGLERVFTVVTPTGDRLYSFTDPRAAEAEATALNTFEQTPLARRAAQAQGTWSDRT